MINLYIVDLYHLGILSEYKLADNGNRIKIKVQNVKNNFDKIKKI